MSLRIAALGLLAQHPGSGYDLLKRFEKSMANVWPATQSQLYGELNKLADTGLIAASDIGPRGRKEYRITPAGRAELLRWVTSPQADPPYRNAALLRVFLLGELPRDAARKHMIAVAEHAEAEVKRLEELRNSIDWGDDDSFFYGRAVLEYGLRRNATEAQWARSVGLIVATESEGSKKLFGLTDDGRAAAEKIETPPWEQIADGWKNEEPGHANLRSAVAQLMGAVAQSAYTATEEQQERIVDIVNTARREIYHILGESD